MTAATYVVIWHRDSFSIQGDNAASLDLFMRDHGVTVNRVDSLMVEGKAWNQYTADCPLEMLHDIAARWSQARNATDLI